MVTCPLCEHQQPFGLECDQCGRDLSGLAGLDALGPPPVADAPLEGLEVTVPGRLGEVTVEPVGGLEQTRLAPVTVDDDPTPELDRGRASVGEVEVERVPDLVPDRAPDDGLRTRAPRGAVRCRYCGHVQEVGAACDRCGFKLTRVAEPTAAAQPGPPPPARCLFCGTPALAGERCPDCGRLVPAPGA